METLRPNDRIIFHPTFSPSFCWKRGLGLSWESQISLLFKQSLRRAHTAILTQQINFQPLNDQEFPPAFPGRHSFASCWLRQFSTLPTTKRDTDFLPTSESFETVLQLASP